MCMWIVWPRCLLAQVSNTTHHMYTLFLNPLPPSHKYPLIPPGEKCSVCEVLSEQRGVSWLYGVKENSSSNGLNSFVLSRVGINNIIEYRGGILRVRYKVKGAYSVMDRGFIYAWSGGRGGGGRPAIFCNGTGQETGIKVDKFASLLFTNY